MFGQNVKRLCEIRGWSLEKLARQVEVSSRMIFYIVQGLRAPSLQLAVSIAEALGTTVDDLLKEQIA